MNILSDKFGINVGAIFGLFLALFLIVLSMNSASAQRYDPRDIGGIWRGDDGATYYIRYLSKRTWVGRYHSDIYWYGETDGFANVYEGRLTSAYSDTTYIGEWADVPSRNASCTGTIGIKIISPTHFVKTVDDSRNGCFFSGTEWRKISDS